MILNGWKEVANYMGRGVRTVQRWERLGLPLHRPNSRLRSAVVATSEELDRWLATCVNGRAGMSLVADHSPDVQGDLSADLARATMLIAELNHLRDASRKMRGEMSAMRLRTQQLRAQFQTYHNAHAVLRETAKSLRERAA